MNFDLTDDRTRLSNGTVVKTQSGNYIIDEYIACGGSALMYIAHLEGSSRYVALKELYPRSVENGIVRRGEDGRIVVLDPIRGEVISEGMPDELVAYLRREAALTRRAASVYGRLGGVDTQNNPDVLNVSGPFKDERGNYYLAVDTAQGQSLDDFITQGFIRDSDGEVIANGNFDELLRILRDTAQILSRLHGDNKMLHLDLSPNNIYLIRSNGGTRLMPRIIDFGSAFDLADERERTDHRFTRNPYSAPEIMALAEFNDHGAGYEEGTYSDTYAVASILFYAVTGTVYSVKLRFDRSWTRKLYNEYSPGWADSREETFANLLIAFFNKALSPDVTERYTTATELYRALSRLIRERRTTGNLLRHVEPDELMSYALLEKHPLYRYKADDGDLHILCLGSGVFVKRMILSSISCGQMIGPRLYIHVVSAESEDRFKNELLKTAPLLEDYSNLTGKMNNGHEYVTFTYRQVENLLDPDMCDEVAKQYCASRYIVISLGSNNRNSTLADMYASCLALHVKSGKDTLIHYYLSEDAARNIRSDSGQESELPEWIHLIPFGDDVTEYLPVVRELGHRTLRMSYLYDKLSDPYASLEKTARNFAGDKYGQRSSCAAALHAKYKLESLGINSSPSTNHRAIIPAYLSAARGPRRGELLELEHRRWIMYMAADGYRFPTLNEINGYAFLDSKWGFNGAFKSTNLKLHHCLVPCSTAGVCLPDARQEWDRYESFSQIDETAYDELDKMSLKVHLLAKKRISNLTTGRILLGDMENTFLSQIELKSTVAEEDIGEAAGEYGTDAPVEQLDKLRWQYESVYSSLKSMVESKSLPQRAEVSRLISEVKSLEEAFSRCGMDASEGRRRVLNDLAIYDEFTKYRDYKRPDETIVDNLLWLLFADEDLTMIKLGSKQLVSNIAGPLIMEPKRLIYYGLERNDNLTRFLRAHGNNGDIRFVPSGSLWANDVLKELTRLRAGFPSGCVIDVTGGDERHIVAATQLALSDSTVALVRRDENTGCMENVRNYPRAEIYRLNAAISAAEAFALYGVEEIVPEQQGKNYMERLSCATDALWKVYRKFQDDWTMITAFFYGRGSGTPELKFRFDPAAKDMTWRRYYTTVDRQIWDRLEIGTCFAKMEEAGFIRDLNVSSKGRLGLNVSLEYMGNAPEQKNDYVLKSLNMFFSKKVWCAIAPYRINISDDSAGIQYINVESGSCVEIYDQKGIDFADKRLQSESGEKRYKYADVIPALKRIEELGLIYDLSVGNDLTNTPISIRFNYSELAVKNCLMTAGNILEFYAWNAAVQTGYFDDCRANFSFRWKENVRNELDLILTKGLTTLVVSCKTAKFKKDHLNEIKDLTERFSLNSKAVILYSSTKAVGEDRHLTSDIQSIKNRAKAMGIYLIDLNDVGDENLGQIFVDIADGKHEA